MKKAISLHIGLNFIDPAHYGTDGKLKNCVNDARAMENIAKNLGYATTTLLNTDATSGRLFTELTKAARQLNSGDILFVTYSGHGAQVKDITNDDEDARDETWCMYDRMVIDDELGNAWTQFKKGVRVIMLSDSCHSGTMSRLLNLHELYPQGVLYRCIDPDIIENVFNRHNHLYTGIKENVAKRSIGKTGASVLLLSGCQDNQLSSDGKGSNGLFTSNLLLVYKNGRYSGSYKSFYSQIATLMPPVQTPKYTLTGPDNAAFEAEQPFVIDASYPAQRNIGFGPNDNMTWTIGFPGSMVDGMGPDEMRMFIQDNMVQSMIDSYNQFHTLNNQFDDDVPRGLEFSISVSSGNRGGEISCGCTGGIRW